MVSSGSRTEGEEPSEPTGGIVATGSGPPQVREGAGRLVEVGPGVGGAVELEGVDAEFARRAGGVARGRVVDDEDGPYVRGDRKSVV